MKKKTATFQLLHQGQLWRSTAMMEIPQNLWCPKDQGIEVLSKKNNQPTNQPNPTLLILRSLASDEFCMPQKTRKFKWKQNSTRHVSAAVFGYIMTFLFLHQEMSESKSENCPPWQLPWHSHFELIEHTNVQLLQVLAGQAGPSYLAQCRAPFVTLKMTA